MTPGAEAAEGTEAQETQNQGIDPAAFQQWQSQMESRMGESTDSLRQLMETVTTRLPEPQAEPEPDFSQQFEELFGDPTQQADPAQVQEIVQQQIQAGIKEAVGPLAEQFQQMQERMTAEKLDGLMQKYPEYQDQKAREGLADNVWEAIDGLGLPDPIAEALARNPNFVEQVHHAAKARELSQQETPAGQGPDTSLETGGGASPGSAEEDPVEAMFNPSGRAKGPLF